MDHLCGTACMCKACRFVCKKIDIQWTIVNGTNKKKIKIKYQATLYIALP